MFGIELLTRNVEHDVSCGVCHPPFVAQPCMGAWYSELYRSVFHVYDI